MDTQQLPLGSQVGRYEVEGLLGRGGHAVVYKVRHRRLGSLHALKVLLNQDAAMRDRLMREGRAQANLRHPNVVSVTDALEVDGAPGLIMEYVRGVTLGRLLELQKLSDSQIDAIARDVMAGVAAAHDFGLVHRDLKPGNVLLQLEADRFVAKVTDFGLVKGGGGWSDAVSTRTGVAMGTPAYMSPEQTYDAAGVDHRADIFALGAVLYEMVTGERAFGGDAIMALRAIRVGDRRPVFELAPDLDPRWERAIEGALQVSLDARWQDVHALAEAWTGERLLAPTSDSTWSEELLAEVRDLDPTSSPSGLGRASRTPTWGTTSDLDQQDITPAPVPVAVPPAPSASVATAPEAQRRGFLWGAGVVGIFAAGVILWMRPPAPEVAAPVEPVLEARVEPARDAEAAQLVPEPEREAAPDEPVADEAPPERVEEVVQQAVEAVPKPALPPPAASPEPVDEPPDEAVDASVAHVEVEGEGVRVYLESAEGRFKAGEVEPGTYRVLAFFDGGDPEPQTTLTLEAGQRVTLRCNPTMRVCQQRP